MAKPFKILTDQMSPERKARIESRVQEAIQEMALTELRQARAFTQEHLATTLKMHQPAVSKMERRADMYISTLRDFIVAMGGQLEIRAIFSDGAVKITQFQALSEAPCRASQELICVSQPPIPSPKCAYLKGLLS